MKVSVDIIIVNWNSGALLKECVDSVKEISWGNFTLQRLVIVDNASSDNSLESVDSSFLPLTLIKNPSNLGFAAACNQGAKDSLADFIIFLNPDTRLFNDSIDKAVSFISSHSGDIGILGVRLIGEHGLISRSCARLPTPLSFLYIMLGLDRILPEYFKGHFMTEWDHLENRYVDQVMGAFFLVPGLLFRELNGFDETFFVYFEEVDFTKRALLQGYRTFYLSDVSIYHKGCGVSEQIKATRLFYFLRSRIQYSYKHFHFIPATLIMLNTVLTEFISRMALTMLNRSMSQAVETIKGYTMLWGSLPEILKNSLHGLKP